MLDPEHDDLVGVSIDPVQDAVRPPSRREYAGQLPAEFLTYAMWIRHQWTGEELDDRSGDVFWQIPLNCPYRGWSDDEFIVLHGELRAECAYCVSSAHHVSARPRNVGLTDVR